MSLMEEACMLLAQSPCFCVLCLCLYHVPVSTGIGLHSELLKLDR